MATMFTYLTPMDFFSRHVVRIKVYDRNPHTVNELKDYISDAFNKIDGDRNLSCTVCCTVCQSVLD